MAIIVFGAQTMMVEKQINKYIKESFLNLDKVDIIRINSSSLTEGNLIDECSQLSFTADGKVIILENCNLLTRERTKDKFVYTDEFIKYLENENPYVKLVFSCVYDKKIDSSNKIYKIVNKKGKIFECKDLKENEWPFYIQKFFEKRSVKISKDAINELSKRCSGDLNIFFKETEKLLLYKMNNIEIDDIEEIVTKPLSNNVFDLLDFLLHDKINKAIDLYRDLQLAKIEPVVLISILSNSLFFLDKVLYLNNIGLNYSAIASKLKSNPYRVKITLDQFRYVKKEKISRNIDNLYFLDKQIKHSEIDRFYGFEMFLLNF